MGRNELPTTVEAAQAWLDQIWHDVRYSSAWESVYEREQAREAVSAFVAYIHANARTMVGTERKVRARVDVPLPNGQYESVDISGYMDRIEADSDGRLYAIDLKTTKTTASAADARIDGQLGIYQLAIAHGALPEGAEPGGGMLVNLRTRTADGMPTVRDQPALTDPEFIETKLGEAVSIIRNESFVACRNDNCRTCDYRTVCPLQLLSDDDEGEEV
jgi:RecB family exonuclease